MTYHHETVQNLIKTGNRTGVWRGRWAIDALGECACTRLAHAGPRWRTAWSTVWPSGRARLCWSCTVWQYFPPKGRLEEKRGSSQKTAASRPASGRSERTAATLEQHWVPTRRWAVCPQHSRAPQVTPQRWRSPGRTEVGQEVRNSCSYLRQARREKASFLLQSKSTGLSIIEIRKTHCRDLPGLT